MSEQFRRSQQRVSELTEDPGNEVKLRLFWPLQQATEGDVSGKRPGFTNPVGRAGHDAWAQYAGMSSADAEAQYIALVDSPSAVGRRVLRP